MSEKPLRHRDFRNLWIGYGLSAFGSQLSVLALPLLVLDTTGSAALAGLVGTLRLLAFTLTQLPGGALADRFARKRMLALADAGRAGALLVVGVAALGGHFPVALLVVTIAAEGLLSSIASSAGMAATPHLIEKKELPAALALSQAQSYAIRLVGPLLGGVLYQWNPAAPFLIDALSYAVSLVFVLSVRRAMGGGSGERTTLRADIAAGIRYVLGSRYLVLLMVWAALANFATAGVSFALVLAVGPAESEALGLATSVVALAGLTGALVAKRGQPASVGRRIELATATMVVLAVAAAFMPGALALTVGMAGIALLSPLVSIPLNARVFALVPDELMGRVQSSLFLIGGCLYPFATVVCGLLTEQFSLGTAVAVFAGVLGLSLVVLTLPALRLPKAEPVPAPVSG
jgi:hypothetical protein